MSSCLDCVRALRAPGGAGRGTRRPGRSRLGGTGRWCLRDVLPPAVLVTPRRGGLATRVGEDKVAHLVEHPLEIVLLDREVVEVGRGIEEVDGVEHAIL